MRLIISDESYEFIPIRDFREAHNLPVSFGVALFEPKDYVGLGSIENAGSALNSVRAALLAAIPAEIPFTRWLTSTANLVRLFEAQLWAINDSVSLRESEIGFAVSGFADVCQAYVYAVIQAPVIGQKFADFDKVYDSWLNSSTRVSQTLHRYTHDGQEWIVKVVTHAYGRAGLIIEAAGETYYVHDETLGCPAEGFMARLLRDVIGALSAAFDGYK